jgi:hypothetical protein
VPLHQLLLLHQLAVVSQMMTVFIAIWAMECRWGSLWRVSGVEVELAWCRIMLRSGPAHLMEHSIMHGIEWYCIAEHSSSSLAVFALNPKPLIVWLMWLGCFVMLYQLLRLYRVKWCSVELLWADEERCGEKLLWPILRHYCGIFLREIQRNNENLSWDSWSSAIIQTGSLQRTI